MFGKKKKWREAKEMHLNISSLMDILTILLLFLIINFDSQEANVKPPKDLKLPGSSSERQVKLAIKITISHQEIRVEDHTVATFVNGKPKPRDIDKTNNTIKPLLRELRKQRAILQRGSHKSTEEDNAEIIYFEAAKGVKFGLIDQIMKTAQYAGFSKFRLAVHRQS